MSVERILGAKSLPDIDLNTADAEPFIKATEELLGKDNCAWMIAWKPLQKASAFRLYCKAIDMDIKDYDAIAKDISESVKSKKNSIYENDEKWGPIIEASKPFVGVVEGISESPCSMLLYDKPVSEEIGLVRTKTKICCLLDGYNCDKYKYLKNDILTTSVWAIIRNTCDLVNIEIPTIKELNELLDDKTYEIYEKGLTCSINQADSLWATSLVKRYKPKSPSEVSAFVAIIRPGCASLLEDFIDRKEYTTGVEKLDILLDDSGRRLIYQESIMKYLIWLGISESHSYDIIKKIAKKKFKEKELTELKAELLVGWQKQVGEENGFEETWRVVEDAAKYSFNSSHSLSYAYDSLYGAYLKSHYPLEYYNIVLNQYQDDEERTERLIKELVEFNIDIEPIKFRYSKSEYTMDKNGNKIYRGIKSIKFLNEKVANDLYSLKEGFYSTFLELLVDISTLTVCNSKQIEILIRLNFFSEFGNNQKLLNTYKLFQELYGKKQIKKDRVDDTLKIEIVEKYSRSTEKTYLDCNMIDILKEHEKNIPNNKLSLEEQLKSEYEYLGSPITKYDVPNNYIMVLNIEEKKVAKLSCYHLKTGKIVEYSMWKNTLYKTIDENTCRDINEFDILDIKIRQTDKMKIQEDGSKVPTGEYYYGINSYTILRKYEKEN